MKFKPDKTFRLGRDSNPWLLRYWCSALPTELSGSWSHTNENNLSSEFVGEFRIAELRKVQKTKRKNLDDTSSQLAHYNDPLQIICALERVHVNTQHCRIYTRFQCYVHRRHNRSSFDMPSFEMLCNLAHIKMITQRTLLRSISTFSHRRWIYLTSN